MRKRLAQVIQCASCAVAVMVLSARAPLDRVSPQLKRAMECMVKVLKTVPGVTNARWVDNWNGVFVEYIAPPEGDERLTIRFQLLNPDALNGRPFEFQTVLGGLMDGDKPPPTYGIGPLGKKWDRKCGVKTLILFV